MTKTNMKKHAGRSHGQELSSSHSTLISSRYVSERWVPQFGSTWGYKNINNNNKKRWTKKYEKTKQKRRTLGTRHRQELYSSKRRHLLEESLILVHAEFLVRVRRQDVSFTNVSTKMVFLRFGALFFSNSRFFPTWWFFSISLKSSPWSQNKKNKHRNKIGCSRRILVGLGFL